MGSQIERIVLFQNAVETLGYFSGQMAYGFEQCGYQVYMIDFDRLEESLSGLAHFALRGRTAFVTFNFIGLSGEDIFLDGNGRYLWEAYDPVYVNILVDHPLYYHTKLLADLGRMTVLCIDRGHLLYLKRFYPGIPAYFLPLAGNLLPRCAEAGLSCGGSRPWEEDFAARPYDLVFTANYVPLEWVCRQMDGLTKEYRQFYMGMAEELIAKPDCPLEVVMERHLVRELGALADTKLRAAMAALLPVDLYVRSYFRGEIVRELAEQGICVQLFGADWDKLPCKRPENLVSDSRMVGSAACVRAVRASKISLNILPWFKDGAHDRVFTAMLQGAACLTDGSGYLREEFVDGEEIAFFSLERRKELPGMVWELLRHPEYTAQVAGRGFVAASGRHTWMERAEELAVCVLGG